MSSINDILRKIGHYGDYFDWKYTNIKPGISKSDFLAILMDDNSEPCYHTIRTVNEKWNLLIDLGFGKLRNGSLIFFNLDKIRTALNIEIEGEYPPVGGNHDPTEIEGASQ